MGAQPKRRALTLAEPPLLLAPMHGLTAPPVRAAIERRSGGGLGAAFTEFICEHAGISPKVARREVVRGEVPLVVQLLGRDPERLALATRRMVEHGADGVDLNVGCPSRTVTRRRRGAALLREPDHLARLLEAMVQAAGEVPVSAKLRAGWDDAGSLCRTAEALEQAGCAFLTLHPRTWRQGYGGEARHELVFELRQRLRIPVVANGDVFFARQARQLLDGGGADGVMVGRGAIRNPWIFAQTAALARGEPPPAPAGADLAAWLGEVEQGYLERFGARRRRGVLARLKDLIGHMAPAIADGGCFCGAALRAGTLEELGVIVEVRLRPLLPEQLLLGPDPPAAER